MIESDVMAMACVQSFRDLAVAVCGEQRLSRPRVRHAHELRAERLDENGTTARYTIRYTPHAGVRETRNCPGSAPYIEVYEILDESGAPCDIDDDELFDWATAAVVEFESN